MGKRAEPGAPDAEVAIDGALVTRLLAEQYPGWAGLPLAPVVSSGTDHVLYRLGADKLVRLPRVARAVGQRAKEHAWLPALAGLPLAIPFPLAAGLPGGGYPWPWSIYKWLDGEPATAARIGDWRQAATALAGFIQALQAMDATGGPRAGAQNEHRGVALIQRDSLTRSAIHDLGGLLDAAALRARWEVALRAPAWRGPSVWLHGDLHPGNLLVRFGHLGAVIDFGLLGVGDPACDLMVAWTFLPATIRPAFRAASLADDAIWARGRGWALSVSLIALAHYRTSNPALAALSRRTIDAVLADPC
jgi:aminoglycoside phosphotransferase (APT) family kinase protein